MGQQLMINQNILKCGNSLQASKDFICRLCFRYQLCVGRVAAPATIEESEAADSDIGSPCWASLLYYWQGLVCRLKGELKISDLMAGRVAAAITGCLPRSAADGLLGRIFLTGTRGRHGSCHEGVMAAAMRGSQQLP